MQLSRGDALRFYAIAKDIFNPAELKTMWFAGLEEENGVKFLQTFPSRAGYALRMNCDWSNDTAGKGTYFEELEKVLADPPVLIPLVMKKREVTPFTVIPKAKVFSDDLIDTLELFDDWTDKHGTTPTIGCVMFNPKEKLIVASDRHKLICRTNMKLPFSKTVYLEWHPLLRNKWFRKDGNVKIALNEKSVQVTCGKVIIQFPRVDGTYPDVIKLLTDSGRKKKDVLVTLPVESVNALLDKSQGILRKKGLKPDIGLHYEKGELAFLSNFSQKVAAKAVGWKNDVVMSARNFTEMAVLFQNKREMTFSFRVEKPKRGSSDQRCFTSPIVTYFDELVMMIQSALVED